MPTLEEIQLQLQQINTPKNIKNSRSIKELPKILWESEQVKKIAQGTYTNSIGILVATNERLLFIDKGLLGGLKVENFPYNKISSIQHKTGLLLGEITIFTSGNTAVINNVEKNNCRDFCDYVGLQLAEKTDHPGTPPQESLPIDESPNYMASPTKSSSLNTQETINTFTEQNKIPVYKKNWFTWLMLFGIYPVGVALMWMFSPYRKKSKVIITCITGIFFLFVLAIETSSTVPNTEVTQQVKSVEEQKQEQKKAVLDWYASLIKELSKDDKNTQHFLDTVNGIKSGSVSEYQAYELFSKLGENFMTIYDNLRMNHDAPSVLSYKQKEALEKIADDFADSVSSKGYACSELADTIDNKSYKPSSTAEVKLALTNSVKKKENTMVQLAIVLKEYNITPDEMSTAVKNKAPSSQGNKGESTLHKLLN